MCEIFQGFALKCWQCRSKDKLDCADPFKDASLGTTTECIPVIGTVPKCKKVVYKGLSPNRPPNTLFGPAQTSNFIAFSPTNRERQVAVHPRLPPERQSHPQRCQAPFVRDRRLQCGRNQRPDVDHRRRCCAHSNAHFEPLLSLLNIHSS